MENTKKKKGDSCLPCGRPIQKITVQKQKNLKLLEKAIEQLNQYCISKKLNRSDAREKILEIIVRGSRHFTALELLGNLQKHFPQIGKATLYRNLPVLVESGVLQEGPHDSNGQVLYELSGDDHHDHIVCLDCRQILEFHDNAIEKRQDQVSSSLHFTARAHRHVIFASCDYLAKEQGHQ